MKLSFSGFSKSQKYYAFFKMSVIFTIFILFFYNISKIYYYLTNENEINEDGKLSNNLLNYPFYRGFANYSIKYKHLNNNDDVFYTIKYFKKKFYQNLFLKSEIELKNENYPGKNGNAVNIKHGDDQNEYYWKEYHKYEFNVLASDQIPLNREIPNKLLDKCYQFKYPKNLPKASIIIVFHNEALSTLLRTIYTAYTRSPSYLIKEFILVDDASNLEKYPHLDFVLENELYKYPNVRLVRQKKRIGLTKAKIIGSRLAKGQVLIFLDSHCECHDGWIEPLLYGIYLNSRIAITPVIFVIKYQDFSINPQIIDFANIGIFNFKMDFNWKNVPLDPHMIFKSPTMAGGLFAIDRDFFFESGAYDDGMGFWGGENLEMSFRLWTCAEGIYINSCSLVGHVFRDKSPHYLPSDSIIINKIRVAEVWLDEYKDIFYQYYPSKKFSDFGNIQSRLDLRKKLNCKSFQWYLDNVATMVKQPDTNPYGKGAIKNRATINSCFDSYDKIGPLNYVTCHNNGGNQHFEYNHDNEIRSSKYCLDNMGKKVGNKVEMNECHSSKGNQEWFHKPVII